MGLRIMQVELSNSADVVWRPDAATVEDANLTRFMRALGVDSFEALNERSSLDPSWFHDVRIGSRGSGSVRHETSSGPGSSWFHDELIRFLDYRFERPYERVLDVSD